MVSVTIFSTASGSSASIRTWVVPMEEKADEDELGVAGLLVIAVLEKDAADDDDDDDDPCCFGVCARASPLAGVDGLEVEPFTSFTFACKHSAAAAPALLNLPEFSRLYMGQVCFSFLFPFSRFHSSSAHSVLVCVRVCLVCVFTTIKTHTHTQAFFLSPLSTVVARSNMFVFGFSERHG